MSTEGIPEGTSQRTQAAAGARWPQAPWKPHSRLFCSWAPGLHPSLREHSEGPGLGQASTHLCVSTGSVLRTGSKLQAAVPGSFADEGTQSKS